MRNFLNNLNQKFAAWMYGRYGYDELNYCLYGVFFVFWILSIVTKASWLYLISLAALLYSMYRSFSRDHLKRSGERLAFLKFFDRIKRYFKQLKQRWVQRKTHKFFRCKQCGVMIRVPKGKGQIEITCTKCGYKFIDRT